MLAKVATLAIRPKNSSNSWVNRLAARDDSQYNLTQAVGEKLIAASEFEKTIGRKVLLMPPDNFPTDQINEEGETIQTKVVDEDAVC